MVIGKDTMKNLFTYTLPAGLLLVTTIGWAFLKRMILITSINDGWFKMHIDNPLITIIEWPVHIIGGILVAGLLSYIDNKRIYIKENYSDYYLTAIIGSIPIVFLGFALSHPNRLWFGIVWLSSFVIFYITQSLLHKGHSYMVQIVKSFRGSGLVLMTNILLTTIFSLVLIFIADI